MCIFLAQVPSHFPLDFFLSHQEIKAAENTCSTTGCKAMLINTNKSHNYEFARALLASTKRLRIPQTAFPRMLEDTLGVQGQKCPVVKQA